MNLHLGQGLMYEGAPELWGCPRMSKEAGQWVIDWYDADGACQSVTVPDEAQSEWIRGNAAAVAQMQAELQQWLRGAPLGS